MKFIKQKFLWALAAGALALAATPAAQATPTLYITDGTNFAIAKDTDADGMISFSGVVGGFTIATTVGLTKPFTTYSDPTRPHMDVNSLTVSGGTGTITIYFVENNFTPNGDGELASIGGTITSGNTVQFSTYYGGNANLDSNNDNAVSVAELNAATQNLLTDSGVLNGTSFSNNTLGNLPASAGVTLTEKIVVTNNGPGSASFNAELQSVPDGGVTLSLLGLSLVGVEALRRKLASS